MEQEAGYNISEHSLKKKKREIASETPKISKNKRTYKSIGVICHFYKIFEMLYKRLQPHQVSLKVLQESLQLPDNHEAE